MYKLLLSGRYLRTRFIALASIISVTLGVATMIVVNAVMAGFSTQMRDRLHGVLADVMVECVSTDGFQDPVQMIRLVEQVAGDQIQAITPVVEIYAMMSFDLNGQQITQPITLVGIVPRSKDLVSPIREYLMSRQALREDGVVVRQPLRPIDAPLDWELTPQAIEHRREWLEWERMRIGMATGTTGSQWHDPFDADHNVSNPEQSAGSSIEHATTPPDPATPTDGMAVTPDQIFGPVGTGAPQEVDLNAPLPARVYVGLGLISVPHVIRDPQTGKTRTVTTMMLEPGEDVRFTTVTVGNPDAARFAATVVDVFKSGMSEYDSTLVFCNLAQLQHARRMLIAPPQSEDDWTQGSVTTLQLKLKNYDDAPQVVQSLLANLPAGEFQVRTWEQKQGPLLQAVDVEAAILNVLLFLIIAVAGFGILAIFYMIVVEKTRDIGILKALGASSGGVMSIFLSYGLGLGLVGSGAGVTLGLLFVRYINQIEDVISWITGHKVFDEAVYYFHEIPTRVSPGMVVWVSIGATVIAVLASVLPARRASQLDPVQALRYE
jgi:lipoprotein-releasing system permease protein